MKMTKLVLVLFGVLVLSSYQNCSPVGFDKTSPTSQSTLSSKPGSAAVPGGGDKEGDDDDLTGPPDDIGYCKLTHKNSVTPDVDRYLGMHRVSKCEYDQPGLSFSSPSCTDHTTLGAFLSPTMGIPTTVTEGVCTTRVACEILVGDWTRRNGGEILGLPVPVQASMVKRRWVQFVKADYCTMGASIYVPAILDTNRVAQGIEDLRDLQRRMTP
jgi:hypothetical protein